MPITSVVFLIGTILMQSILMQLSKKQKTFSELILVFSEFRLNFEHFKEKMTLIPHAFRTLDTGKDLLI